MALCRKYLKAQTLQPDEWIIGDETNGSLPPWKRPPPGKRRGVKDRVWHVYKMLMKRAVERGHTRIIFMEDDDWYSPTYLETRVREMETAPAVTGKRALHWHVGIKAYRWFTGPRHEHVSQLGMHASTVPWLLAQPRIEALAGIKGRIQTDPLVNVEVKAPDSLMGGVAREDNPWIHDPDAKVLKNIVPKGEVALWETVRG